MDQKHERALDLQALKDKYDKLYTVETVLEIDDYTTESRSYLFKKPTVASYDRFVKTASQSPTKATKTFVLDNIIPEQEDALKEDLEEFPALAVSLNDKLFSLLGMSKDVSIKKL